jgi:hypothetical protein
MLRVVTRSSNLPGMPDSFADDEIVYQSSLQLWAAAQTDFDPYAVPPEEWDPAPVPIRDVDIATDTGLEIDAVRECLRRLDGRRLTLGRDAGTLSVLAPVTEGGPP